MKEDNKKNFSEKQKEKVEQLIEENKRKGMSDEEADRRAWETVNLEPGGDKKSSDRTGDR